MTADPLHSEKPPDPALAPAVARLSDEAARGMRMVLRGLAANTLLAAIKIFAGLAGHTYALIADGVESMTDVVGSLVVFGGLRIAALPPDEKHPFGHGKAESLSALIVAVALLATAGGIAAQSVREIISPSLDRRPAPFTLIVLVIAIVTKELMFRMLHRGGKAIGSQAVQADAWHHRSDAIASAAAFVGISISLAGGPASSDAWAALVVCFVIAANGVHLFRRNLDDMMDSAPPPEVELEIRRIARAVHDVAAVEKCRVRRSGLSRLVEIHIEVDGDLTVRRGHEIAHDVKQALLDANLSILDVAVHVEPAGGFSEGRKH